MKQLGTILVNMYLDYFNNYLTLALFSEHHGISLEEAEILIIIGKRIHEERVKNFKGE